MSLNRFIIGTALGIACGASIVLKYKSDLQPRINNFTEDLSEDMLSIFEKTNQLKAKASAIQEYVDEVATPVIDEIKQEVKDYQYQIKPRIAIINEKAEKLQSNFEK